MKRERLSHALQWVDELAGQLRQQPARNVRQKTGHQDLVSAQDEQVERQLRQLIGTHFSQDGVLAEEGTAVHSQGGGLWVIDPIDGTTNYLSRHRDFSISLAFVMDGVTQFGLVADVMAGTLYRTEQGGGAWRDGLSLTAANVGAISDMILTTPVVNHLLLDEHPRRSAFQQMAQEVRAVRSAGCVSLELCQVAAGEAQVMVAMCASPWDYAAGKLLVEEVGGCLCTLEGDPLPPLHNGAVVACASKLIQEKIMPYLRAAL